jgi:hypothetical protein
MSEQQKAQLVLIMVLLVILLIRIIPLIIHRYRLSLTDRLTPYAYLELKATKKMENSSGIGCDIELNRICNKLGLLVLLSELDTSLQQKNGVTLQEIVDEMEEMKKKGLLRNVENAD